MPAEQTFDTERRKAGPFTAGGWISRLTAGYPLLLRAGELRTDRIGLAGGAAESAFDLNGCGAIPTYAHLPSPLDG